MSDDDLIPTTEAARLLGKSPQQVRQLARLTDDYRLPGTRVGRDWVFRRGDVKAYKGRPVGRPKRKDGAK